MILTHLLAIAVVAPDQPIIVQPAALTQSLVDTGALVATALGAPQARPFLRVRAANTALPVRRS